MRYLHGAVGFIKPPTRHITISTIKSSLFREPMAYQRSRRTVFDLGRQLQDQTFPPIVVGLVKKISPTMAADRVSLKIKDPLTRYAYQHINYHPITTCQSTRRQLQTCWFFNPISYLTTSPPRLHLRSDDSIWEDSLFGSSPPAPSSTHVSSPRAPVLSINPVPEDRETATVSPTSNTLNRYSSGSAKLGSAISDGGLIRFSSDDTIDETLGVVAMEESSETKASVVEDELSIHFGI